MMKYHVEYQNIHLFFPSLPRLLQVVIWVLIFRKRCDRCGVTIDWIMAREDCNNFSSYGGAFNFSKVLAPVCTGVLCLKPGAFIFVSRLRRSRHLEKSGFTLSQCSAVDCTLVGGLNKINMTSINAIYACVFSSRWYVPNCDSKFVIK